MDLRQIIDGGKGGHVWTGLYLLSSRIMLWLILSAVSRSINFNFLRTERLWEILWQEHGRF